MFDPFALDDDDTVNLPQVRVTLSIEGSGLDPDFLTQQLGVTPTWSARPGEATDGTRRHARGDSGVWAYRLELPEPTELGETIGLLLDAFPEDTVLWEELTSTYTVEVLCAVHLVAAHQHTNVEPDVLAGLGRRGLPLRIELFGPEDGQD